MLTRRRAIIASALALTLLAGPVQAQDLKKVSLSYTGFSNVHMPFFLAQRLGYYRDEGVDLDMILMKGEIAVKSAATDSIDFTAAAGGALPAILRGLKLRILMVLADRPSDIDVVVQPKVKSFADLKGGTIATSGLGDFTDVLTRTVLKKNGLNPDSDMIMMTLGTSGDRLAALQGGAVTAATLSPPHNFMAEQKGLKKLAAMGDFLKLIYGGIAVSEKRLRSDPETVAKVLRATAKGLAYYRTRKPETVKVITELFKVDDATADSMYEATLSGFTTDGTVTEKNMGELVAPVQASVNVPNPPGINQIFDFAPLQRINGELSNAGWKP